MYYYNNEFLPLDRPFSDVDGNQYPADWLRKSTQEQRDDLGIAWSSAYDNRFYLTPGVPKDLDDLKVEWMAEERSKAYSQLQPTDWYITRMIEMPQCECPQEVKDERKAIRDRCNLQEAKINQATTVEELTSVVL